MVERREGLDDRARHRIQTWIHATGITQTALADRIGKNQAWMSRYLSREFVADLDTLSAMADVFGHSIAALLDAATDPEEQRVIDAYRALDEAGRALVLPLFRTMTQKPRTRRRRA